MNALNLLLDSLFYSLDYLFFKREKFSNIIPVKKSNSDNKYAVDRIKNVNTIDRTQKR